MATRPTIMLSRKGVAWWRTGHPWIFRDDLLPGPGAPAGEIVAVLDNHGRFLGQAFYSATSRVALRFLTTAAEPIDAAFWEARLQQALAYRRRVVHDSTAYRLIYAEADGFPGLIVDNYAGHLVLQVHHAGCSRCLSDLLPLCQRLLPVRSITLRNDSEVRRLEGLPLEVQTIFGTVPEDLTIQEGPLQFRVDILKGQKTGLFLDQRENRQAAAAWAQGEVLDCFSYQGGFALHAARRARRVTAVEASAFSLQVAEENARLNGLANIHWVQANVFDFLKKAVSAGQQYDLIILDPPAFAKSRADRQAAVKGYRDLNRRALQLLRPGGILVTNSCSYNLPLNAFLDLLRQAAQEAQRSARLIDCRGAARDHPALLALPESSYLKCIVALTSADGCKP
ncbi:MAG: class I SAM-dependent rRNA methyltransferase [Desulfobacca sp.]|uniref:class I SAM-dependent rRNA methyltransferase n=1 Tax=Desulfobacca sp. TaxID=2067990 RepID=UPI00404A3298